MSPRDDCRQFSHSLCEKSLVRVCLVHLAHPPHICGRKASHGRELPPRISRQPFYDCVSPSQVLLLLCNLASDVPIQQNQVPVDSPRRGELG